MSWTFISGKVSDQSAQEEETSTTSTQNFASLTLERKMVKKCLLLWMRKLRN